MSALSACDSLANAPALILPSFFLGTYSFGSAIGVIGLFGLAAALPLSEPYELRRWCAWDPAATPATAPPGAARGPRAPPGRRTLDVSPDPDRAKLAPEELIGFSSRSGDFPSSKGGEAGCLGLVGDCTCSDEPGCTTAGATVVVGVGSSCSGGGDANLGLGGKSE